MTYTQEFYDKQRQFGNVTPNGVVFHDELCGPGGVSILLLREEQHTNTDMTVALNWLRNNRDVVCFNIARKEKP